MTREEILNMPAGREMDALIAQKIFGFTVDDNFYIQYYSISIIDAWSIVLQMGAKHFRYEIGGGFMGSNKNYAAFDNEMLADSNPLFKVWANTAPLAICRAALLAVMEAE